MKLAVSSIAWTNEEEAEVAELLRSLGVKYVELAPTKLWQDPTRAPEEEITRHKSFWLSYDIEIIAFQSMLFNRPNLKIFESASDREEAVVYLSNFAKLADAMGARVMVFGSPKNRQIGSMDANEANAIAKEFFTEIGDNASRCGVKLCIEPNPEAYACDFVTNAKSGIEIVKDVANDGFGLHLDIAGMTLAGDDIEASIREAAPYLEHFHISSPMLEPVEDRDDVKHAVAATTLRNISYSKFVSIEMRPGALGENVERVRKAVAFAQATYSS